MIARATQAHRHETRNLSIHLSRCGQQVDAAAATAEVFAARAMAVLPLLLRPDCFKEVMAASVLMEA